ncbi:MAG: hypothetical protein QME78_02745 [Thermodesulfobacteriota bacterium]|nr:hypothetical protein [Thermodesulfobacteriota bacterium]
MEISWHFTEGDFFGQLPGEKKDFISLSTPRFYEKNQFIFLAGNTGNSAFCLEEGKVRIFRITPYAGCQTAGGRAGIGGENKAASFLYYAVVRDGHGY